MSLIRQLDYLFVSSEAIRREYTNYVLIQKQQILENVTHTANQSYAASTYGGNQLDASGQSFRQSVQYGKMKPGKRSAQGSERDHMIALNKENHGIRGSIAADKQRFSEMESASKTSKTKKKDKKEKKMKKKKSKKETHLLDSDQDEIEEQQEQQQRNSMLEDSIRQGDTEHQMNQINEEEESDYDDDQDFRHKK